MITDCHKRLRLIQQRINTYDTKILLLLNTMQTWGQDLRGLYLDPDMSAACKKRYEDIIADIATKYILIKKRYDTTVGTITLLLAVDCNDVNIQAILTSFESTVHILRDISTDLTAAYAYFMQLLAQWIIDCTPICKLSITAITYDASGLHVTFDDTINHSGTAGFTLYGQNGSVILTSTGNNGNTMSFSSDRQPIYETETLTLSYSPGTVVSDWGCVLEAQNDLPVTNNAHTKCKADFTCDNTGPRVNELVYFKDASEGIGYTCHWDFGDGTTSTEQNPGHAYTGLGTCPVILTITNYDGSDTMTKQDYIVVQP